MKKAKYYYRTSGVCDSSCTILALIGGVVFAWDGSEWYNIEASDISNVPFKKLSAHKICDLTNGILVDEAYEEYCSKLDNETDNELDNSLDLTN